VIIEELAFFNHPFLSL